MVKSTKKDSSSSSKRLRKAKDIGPSKISKAKSTKPKALTSSDKGKQVDRQQSSSANVANNENRNTNSSSKRNTAASAIGESRSTSSSRSQPTRILSDDDSEDDEDDGEESSGSESEDPDLQLGLRPTLRVVSKATVRRTWKPVSVKTRTHVQTLVAGLFPAAISRARGEKRKIAVQTALNSMMHKLNDCLSELDVPPPGKDRGLNYAQLMARNRDLEMMLVPDLEHIRDLELRLEQEQILAEQDEAQLLSFKEKKRALDQRTRELQRSKLHPLLKNSSLTSAMATLCKANHDYGHLSVADQRLLSMMAPPSQDESFSGAEVRETMYNPDQDLKINKMSKRLGNRLMEVEQNTEGLDPLLQLVAQARDRVKELASSSLSQIHSGVSASSSSRSL